MTDITRPPLVRRGFLRWSTVGFVLLLPFVGHAIWDYVETRELNRRIAAIEARGEPIRVRAYSDPKGDARTAQAYYRAAGALASTMFPDASEAWKTFLEATKTRIWSDEIVEQLRAPVASSADALHYADLASELPFSGFVGTYTYLASDMVNVGRLSGFRAIVLAADGNGDAAMASLFVQARGARTVTGRPYYWFEMPLEGVQAVLERTLDRQKPSKAALGRLAGVFEQMDEENGLRAMFLQLRAQAIDSPETNPLRRNRNWADAIPRPWGAHQLNASLAIFDRLIEAADGSWPGQTEKIRAVAPQNLPVLLGSRTSWRDLVEFDTKQAARDSAGIRVVRAVLAVEMYRRDHAEQMPANLGALVPDYVAAVPADPYTGRPLTFVSDGSAYAVYSTAENGRDDGGSFIPARTPGRNTFESTGPDIGIRVPLHQPKGD